MIICLTKKQLNILVIKIGMFLEKSYARSIYFIHVYYLNTLNKDFMKVLLSRKNAINLVIY